MPDPLTAAEYASIRRRAEAPVRDEATRDRKWLVVEVDRLLTLCIAHKIADRAAEQQHAKVCAERDQLLEWSNELAQLIPDGDDSIHSNPEGAQESIILDCFRAYVAERDQLRSKVAHAAAIVSGDARWEAAEELARLRAAVRQAREVIDDITITDPGLVVVRVGKILDALNQCTCEELYGEAVATLGDPDCPRHGGGDHRG